MSAESSRLHAARSSAGRRAPEALEGSAGRVAPGRLVPGPVTETRRRVIAATNDLIDRHTYRAVTIDAVARASGVSKSTIYRHWPSRQVLVLEAFNRKDRADDERRGLRGRLRRPAALPRQAGVLPRLRRGGVDGLRAHRRRPDEEFARLFHATVVRGRRRAFGDIVRRGQRQGRIRADVDAGVVVDAPT